MAAELLLHAKKEDFLNLIEQLDGKMNQLRGTLSSYQTLKNDVSMFMDGNDSNFEKMQQNVDANIEAVKRAIALTKKSKDNLQKTVDQMDSMGSKASSMLDEGVQAATNAIKTAIRIEGLNL